VHDRIGKHAGGFAAKQIGGSLGVDLLSLSCEHQDALDAQPIDFGLKLAYRAKAENHPSRQTIVDKRRHEGTPLTRPLGNSGFRG